MVHRQRILKRQDLLHVQLTRRRLLAGQHHLVRRRGLQGLQREMLLAHVARVGGGAGRLGQDVGGGAAGGRGQLGLVVLLLLGVAGGGGGVGDGAGQGGNAEEGIFNTGSRGSTKVVQIIFWAHLVERTQ